MTNSIAEFENADCILIIGSNTMEQHPLIAKRMLKAKEKGAKLIVADPRRIPMMAFADVALQLKPGTDIALLNGLMNVIIGDGLTGSNTDAFGFTESLRACAPEWRADGGPVVVLDGEYHDHMTPGKLRKLITSVREAEGKEAADV